ncbi:hypothetical protein K2X05_14155 [bacterium]|nr:hypothetical protein [bacterium]
MFLLMMICELLLSISFAADFRTRFSCATDHLTTSFALIENKDSFELQVMHHNGVDFIPIHLGLITAYDLTYLKEVGDLFKKMGAHYTIQFKKENCTNSNNEWSCSKNEVQTIGTLDVKSLFFSLSKSLLISSIGQTEYRNANVSIVVGSNSYTIPMQYSAENCVFYP